MDFPCRIAKWGNSNHITAFPPDFPYKALNYISKMLTGKTINWLLLTKKFELLKSPKSRQPPLPKHALQTLQAATNKNSKRNHPQMHYIFDATEANLGWKHAFQIPKSDWSHWLNNLKWASVWRTPDWAIPFWYVVCSDYLIGVVREFDYFMMCIDRTFWDQMLRGYFGSMNRREGIEILMLV